jgi:MEMO1 family protein
VVSATVVSASVVTRPAAVAGQFYPAAPVALDLAVRGLLARGAETPIAALPKVLIVPHAGYIYSGPTAARAYAGLKDAASRIRRVVLVGPAHRVAIDGVAVPDADRFATPLGSVDVDRAAIDALVTSPEVLRSDHAHAAEHALEVQLPFLQCMLDAFTIVPLVVGDAGPDAVAAVLEQLWGGDETLIIVSSDLSHYLSYDDARRVDSASVQQILSLGPDLTHAQACGATPVNAVFRVAARRGLTPHLLAACNSGDTAGDRTRVVGYAAFAFTLTGKRDARGDALLALARRAVESLLRGEAHAQQSAADDFLDRPGAAFVTLLHNGELRGCIGSLVAERSLRDDIIANARAAAGRDPRFPPVTASDLDGLSIEVSLLSEPQQLVFRDEADVLRQLATSQDGVILETARHRSTFLPQVWEHISDPREFLRQLKLKAGLPADFWSTELRVSRYTVDKWCEPSKPKSIAP